MAGVTGHLSAQHTLSLPFAGSFRMFSDIQRASSLRPPRREAGVESHLLGCGQRRRLVGHVRDEAPNLSLPLF